MFGVPRKNRILPTRLFQKTQKITLPALSAWLFLSTGVPVLAAINNAPPFLPQEAKSLTAGAQYQHLPESGPKLLNFAQLNALAWDPKNAAKLQDQIQAILNTPFVFPCNSTTLPSDITAEGSEPDNKTPVLRVANWNIERGFQVDHMIEALKDLKAVKKPDDVKAEDFDAAQKEAEWLSKSRVIFMEETDLGMNRTHYENIAKKMGTALNMHAVYGVEFLELSPLYFRQKKLQMKKQQALQSKKGTSHAASKHTASKSFASKSKTTVKPDSKTLSPDTEANLNAEKIDPKQYKGLHGTTILTNYPILHTEIIRLPNVYNWYSKERNKISQLEKIKRKAADKVFLEEVLSEIRYGSRMAVVVDISVPELPEHKATLVAVHLENRVNPAGRKLQMDYLLSQLKNRHNPIVMGGDWNTTGTDSSPTSIRKEIRRYATDPVFWARRAVNWLTPYGILAGLTLDTGQFSKNLFDPTAPNVPFLSPNKERALFKGLGEFQFQDGTVFDTRGDKAHVYGDATGFLANSNQRWMKGFVPTFNFERPIFKGLFGRYKLDWFIVKDYAKLNVDDEGETSDEPKGPSKRALWKEQPYLFAPHNARTLDKIDSLYSTKLSDHVPLTIDLFLQEPFNKSNSASDKVSPVAVPTVAIPASSDQSTSSDSEKRVSLISSDFVVKSWRRLVGMNF